MKKTVLLALVTVFVLSVIPGMRIVTLVSANPKTSEPIYSTIAEYYDNRKAVVTLTADDWDEEKEQYFEDMCSMLTAKKIYHTGGIVTSQNPNWTQIQHWLNQGYTEAASHSRTHPAPPYEDYDSEIGGSKEDIIDNLTLPPVFSFKGNEYVYTWIEPGGETDLTVKQKLVYYRYIVDRSYVSAHYGWAAWRRVAGSTNGLFVIGYSIRADSSEADLDTLNAKYDSVYNAGKIYHLMCHPKWVDWSPNSKIDHHTDHIKGKLDVWYVNFGLLYLYRWIATQDIVQITSSGSGQDKIFKISSSSTDRQNFGARYPVTYVFDIPTDWTSGYVYYRYRKEDPWMLMENKSSTDFFNGINASRFDFASHKAYVSVGFSNVSNRIYLQVRSTSIHDIAISNVTAYPTKVKVGQPVSIAVEAKNEGIVAETFDVSLYYDTELIETRTGVSLDAGAITTLSFTWDTTDVAWGAYAIKAVASTVAVEEDVTDNTCTDGEVIFIDELPPVTRDDYDGSWYNEDFTITLTATDDHSGVQAIHYRVNGGPTESVQADGQPRTTTEGNNKLEYWSVDEAGNEETHHIIDVKLDKTAPVADEGGDRSVAQNVLVTFDASRSSDNLGIVSYEWDFGDGSKGTGLTTTHTYKEPGTYVVWLTVEDAADNKNTSSVSVTVLKDTDGDGTPDATDTDDDGDEMPDAWELSYGLDPLDATDATLDPDVDGLPNLEEYQAGNDPTSFFSPFPWWMLVLIAAFGTIFIIVRYAKALPGK